MYDRIGRTNLPYGTSPLIFHELTTLPRGAEGEEIFQEYVQKNVVLTPLRWRDEEVATKIWATKGKREVGTIFAHDRAAGDDAYLFFTPCHPLTSANRPAVAFDARTLVQQSSNPGFRPTDLEPYYVSALRKLGVDTEEGDEEYESAVDSISDELGAVAEILTRTGEIPVLGLIHLYSNTLFRSSDYVDSYDLQSELLRLVQPELNADTVAWLEEQGVELDPGQEWIACFGRIEKYPFVSATPPEVLIDVSAPLRSALFFRNADGKWEPMQETKEQMTANPLYVSPSNRHISLDGIRTAR